MTRSFHELVDTSQDPISPIHSKVTPIDYDPLMLLSKDSILRSRLNPPTLKESEHLTAVKTNYTLEETNQKVPNRPEAPMAWIVQGDSTVMKSWTARSTIENTDWMNLMTTINMRYAERHNYGYTRFLFEDSNSCIHPQYNQTRHVAWCKLLAIQKMMETVPSSVRYLIWLDSDAMLQQHDLDIEQVIDSLQSGCSSHNLCNTAICQHHKKHAALITAANQPFCGESPLTAFQIWNLHERLPENEIDSNNDIYYYQKILRAWWNSNRCSQQHPWEQRAFARDVYPKFAIGNTDPTITTTTTTNDDLDPATRSQQYRGGIAILYGDVNHPKLPEATLRQQFLRHVGHFGTLNGAGTRLSHAQNVAEYVKLENKDFQRLQQQLHGKDRIKDLKNYPNMMGSKTLSSNDFERLANSLWIEPTNKLEMMSKNNHELDCEYVVNPIRHPPAQP